MHKRTQPGEQAGGAGALQQVQDSGTAEGTLQRWDSLWDSLCDSRSAMGAVGFAGDTGREKEGVGCSLLEGAAQRCGAEW